MYLVKKCDVIIPGSYDYSIGYKGNLKLMPAIPMPVNTEDIKYNENIIGDKIVFFHGLNREKDKGTKYIREALSIIEQKYPKEVEVIIDGHMPYDSYLKLMRRTNVVIDQCSTYGYGINALIALCMGKVVVAGARKELMNAYGIKSDDCPIIHAEPNVKQLVSQFEFIIKNKDMIKNIGKKSRQYVEKYHDSCVVAHKYINVWEKLRECK